MSYATEAGGYELEPVDGLPKKATEGPQRRGSPTHSAVELIGFLKATPGQWYRVHDDHNIQFKTDDNAVRVVRDGVQYVRYNPKEAE